MASCVFGAGANELAEASIVASTKVRMTTAATMAARQAPCWRSFNA